MPDCYQNSAEHCRERNVKQRSRQTSAIACVRPISRDRVTAFISHKTIERDEIKSQHVMFYFSAPPSIWVDC